MEPTSETDQATILAAIQDLQRKLVELRQQSVPLSTPVLPNSSSLLSSSSTNNTDTASSLALTPPKRLLVVANRLPMSITKDSGPAEVDNKNYTFKMSSGGLVSALISIRNQLPFVWIGWPGKSVPDADKSNLSKQLFSEHNCIPVYLSDELVHEYYDGFSNDVLWPNFHYEFQPGSTNQKFNYDLWKKYETANEIFADTIINIAQEGDAIWIHDYHLMLLPSLLRRKMPPSTIIAWFLHTPWPSSEIFRTLPPHVSILRGLMGADLLGFHTVDFSRHFLSSCVRSLRGVESTPSSLTYRNRTTQLGVFPIGIEPENFVNILRTDECQKKLTELRSYYGNVRIMVSVDRLDPIKGVPHRLLALEELFRRHKEWIGKITLIQVAVPSRIDVVTYQQLTSTVNTLIGRINSTYGTVSYTPIHYMYRSIQPSELTALYACADIGLITSLRDGMNLVSFEYVATHGGIQDMYYRTSTSQEPTENNSSEENFRKEESTGTNLSSALPLPSVSTTAAPVPGILILSEFAGASQSLAGSLRCNPWNIYELAETIHTALMMNDNERRLRFDKLIRYVRVHTSAAWATTYVQTMLTVGKQRIDKETNLSTSSTSHHSIRPLPIDAMLNDYKIAYNRVIILAYEEALSTAKEYFRYHRNKENRTGGNQKTDSTKNNESSKSVMPTHDEEGNDLSILTSSKSSINGSTISSYQRPFSSPSNVLLETLKQLTDDTRNIVILVSSASMHVLDQAFASVPGLRIIAESGSVIRTPTYTSPATISSSFTATGKGSSLPLLLSTNIGSTPVLYSPTYKWPSTPLHNIRNFRYPKPTKYGTEDRTVSRTADKSNTGTGETSSSNIEPPSVPLVTGAQWTATVPYIIGAPLRSFQTIRKTGNDQYDSTVNVGNTNETLPLSVSSVPNQSSMHWKEMIRSILHDYTISTPGSVIDETPNTLIWRYDNSDSELALWNSKELQFYLSSQVTTITPLDIIIPPNSKSIEIHVRDASVLTGLIHILDDYSTTQVRFRSSSSSSGNVSTMNTINTLPIFQFGLCITDTYDISGIASASLAISDNVTFIGGSSDDISKGITQPLPNLSGNMYMTRVAASSMVGPHLSAISHTRTGSTTVGTDTTTSSSSVSIPRWTRGGNYFEAYRTVIKKIDYEIINSDQVQKILQQLK